MPKGYKANKIPRANEYVIEEMSVGIYECILGRDWTENVYLKGKTNLDMGDNKDFVILDNVLLRYIGTDRKPVVPENVERICERAFYGCDVETVILHEGIKDIANHTFLRTNMEYIDIPSSVTHLGNLIFGYSKIKELFIPKTVEMIDMAFAAQLPELEKVIFEGRPNFKNDNYGVMFNASRKLRKENVIFLDESYVVPEEFWEFCEGVIYPDETTAPTATAAPTSTPKPTETTKPTAEPTAEPSAKPTTEPTTAPTEAPKKTISVTTTNGEIEVTAEDKRVEFTDVKPFVDEANRTQMPIRVLAEMLGFNVNWNDNTKTATLENDENTITVKIGENTINKNNETITMDTTAKVINDRTYIPLRAISEALGYVVEWK